MTVYCFLELSVGLAAIPGKVILELFDTHVPKVVENFRALCTGEYDHLAYQGTEFHRIVETFTIQGGDTSGSGTGGSHIYGADADPFAGDDLFWRDIDEEMLLCMAEVPPRSQFFITLRPSPHLNGSHCCFGRVIRGQQILQQISELEVDDEDKPLESVTISRCGELEYKGPNTQAAATTAVNKNEDGRETPSKVKDSNDEESHEHSLVLAKAQKGARYRGDRDHHRRSRSRDRYESHRPRYDRSSRSPYSRPPRHDDERELYRRRERPERTSYSRDRYSKYHGSTRQIDDDSASIKYKGRGKMVYQSQAKPKESYGRLT